MSSYRRPMSVPGTMDKANMTSTAPFFAQQGAMNMTQAAPQARPYSRANNPLRYGSRPAPRPLKTRQDYVAACYGAPSRQAWSQQPTFRFLKRSAYDEPVDLMKVRHHTRGDVYYRPAPVEFVNSKVYHDPARNSGRW